MVGITLYKMLDDNNTIGKTLTDGVDFNIVFKDNANVGNPRIKLRTDKPIHDYNYCYIPNFNRYYFITDTDIKNNSLFDIGLRVDVLESFKDDILDSEGVISRAVDGNKYYGVSESENKKEVDIFESDKEIEFTEENILVVIK